MCKSFTTGSSNSAPAPAIAPAYNNPFAGPANNNPFAGPANNNPLAGPGNNNPFAFFGLVGRLNTLLQNFEAAKNQRDGRELIVLTVSLN